VIHAVQQGDVHIAEITGNEESHDLTFPVRPDLVPVCPTLRDQVNVIRSFAFSDQVLMSRKDANVPRRLLQDVPVSRRKSFKAFQLAYEEIEHDPSLIAAPHILLNKSRANTKCTSVVIAAQRPKPAGHIRRPKAHFDGPGVSIESQAP
jgi:hypothetical protein